MRLIDADEAVKAVHDEFDECLVWDESGETTANEVENIILQIPTVDPVKHGHWIIRDIPGTYFYQIICSECGEDVTSTAPCIGFLPDARVLWDYCPYCGAKMDEVKDGNT